MSEAVVLAVFSGVGGLLTLVGTVVTAVLSSKNVARDQRITDLEKTVSDLRNELDLERKDNTQLRADLRALREQLDAKDGEVRDLKNKLALSNRRITELEAQVKRTCA